MPTGPWTVPTSLTTPELATATTTTNVATTINLLPPLPLVTTTTPAIQKSGSNGSSGRNGSTLAPTLWPLPTRVDPYAIYIAASIKLIEISARHSRTSRRRCCKESSSVRSSRVLRGRVVLLDFRETGLGRSR